MNSGSVVTNDNTDLHFKYYLYGWGRFRSRGFLSKPLSAYIILCTCVFLQNFSVNGANNAVISTLERVFYLNSVQSGLFLATYDLATVVSSPFVGYLGSLYPSPIFFSLNMIILTIGNVLIASSSFINQNNNLRINGDNAQNFLTSNNVLFQCSNNSFFSHENTTTSICLKENHLSMAIKNAKFLLYAGNFINGIGSVALFTIGIPYIERIFPPAKAAYCQGIYFAVGTVGGALGIVATGRFLSLYTTLVPRRYIPAWLTPSHSLWIGCWWLPYFIYGSLCLLFSIIASGLPNYALPDKKQLNYNRVHDSIENKIATTSEKTFKTHNILSSQLTNSKNKSSQESISSPSTQNNTTDGIINHGFSSEHMYSENATTDSVVSGSIYLDKKLNQQELVKKNLKNLCFIIWELLTNVRCLFIIIANLFEGVLLKGFVPFITQYFEYQHQLDASTATLITGTIALLSVVIGCPAGVYFMNKYSWTPVHCARICSIILISSSFLFLFLIFYCPELKFQHSTCLSMNTACCNQVHDPVCDINNPQKMFLSPCHLGCTTQTLMKNNNTIFYSSCNCETNTIVSETVCRFRRIPCTAIFVFTLLGATFLIFFTAFIQVHMLEVLLHSVPLVYQNMALALRQTIVRVLGQTTGPLLFGYMFDQACLVWLTDCYSRRTCKVYDNHRMSLSMALSGFSVRLASGIACGIVYIKWKSIQSYQVATTSNNLPTHTDDSIVPHEENEITRL